MNKTAFLKEIDNIFQKGFDEIDRSIYENDKRFIYRGRLKQIIKRFMLDNFEYIIFETDPKSTFNKMKHLKDRIKYFESMNFWQRLGYLFKKESKK